MAHFKFKNLVETNHPHDEDMNTIAKKAFDLLGLEYDCYVADELEHFSLYQAMQRILEYYPQNLTEDQQEVLVFKLEKNLTKYMPENKVKSFLNNKSLNQLITLYLLDRENLL